MGMKIQRTVMNSDEYIDVLEKEDKAIKMAHAWQQKHFKKLICSMGKNQKLQQKKIPSKFVFNLRSL